MQLVTWLSLVSDQDGFLSLILATFIASCPVSWDLEYVNCILSKEVRLLKKNF